MVLAEIYRADRNTVSLSRSLLICYFISPGIYLFQFIHSLTVMNKYEISHFTHSSSYIKTSKFVEVLTCYIT